MNRSLKWTIRAAVIAVLAIFVFSIRTRVELLVRFYLATGSAQSLSARGSEQILRDDLRILTTFTPQHISEYLDSSRWQWRSIASRVLRSQAQEKKHKDWEGIAPALARVALSDPESFIRESAQKTFQSLPEVTIADGRRVLVMARESQEPEQFQLISSLAAKCPKVRDEIHETLRRHIESAATGGDEALFLLATLFPEDDEVPARLRQLCRDGQYLKDRIASALASIVTHRPEMLREMLEGTATEQQVALITICRPSLPLAAPPPKHAFDEIAARLAMFDRSLIVRAIDVAHALLREGDPPAQLIAINFLRGQPDGGHSLIQHLSSESRETRIQILQCLQGIAWAAYTANDGAFQFTSQEGDSLIQLLNDSDEGVREQAAQVINPGIPPSPRPLGAFVPSTGPLNPANAAVFSRALDPGSLHVDSVSLNYFARVTPFAEEDIARIAAAVRRRPGSFQGRTAFDALVARFPSHPETRKLMADIFKAGQIEYSARRIFESATGPELLDLAHELCSSSGSNESIVASALVYRLRWEDDIEPLESAITQLYEKTTVQTGQWPWLYDPQYFASAHFQIIRQVVRAGTNSGRPLFPDLVKKMLITELLPRLWTAPSWPEGLPTRDEIDAWLGPQKVAEFEQLAMRVCFREAIFSGESPISTESLADFGKRLHSLPGFADEAGRAFRQYVALNDPRTRARALYFVATSRLNSTEIQDIVLRAMDDKIQNVQVAAADALGLMGCQTPLALSKLRNNLNPKTASPVRSAAVRNLMLLASDDPEVRSLCDSLADDPDFAVRTEARAARKRWEADQ
jgi:hypothetical protein